MSLDTVQSLALLATPPSLFVTEAVAPSEPQVIRSADDLCDELTDHMLECEECLTGCLDGHEESCFVYREMRKQIEARGGTKRGMLLAI